MKWPLLQNPFLFFLLPGWSASGNRSPKGRTGLPVWPWRPKSRSEASVKAVRSTPRRGLALTGKRSEG